MQPGRMTHVLLVRCTEKKMGGNLFLGSTSACAALRQILTPKVLTKRYKPRHAGTDSNHEIRARRAVLHPDFDIGICQERHQEELSR